MKILVADKISQAGVDRLRGLGCDVVCSPDLAGEALVRALAESECRILMVRGTKVTAEAIRANRHLSDPKRTWSEPLGKSSPPPFIVTFG